MFRLCKKLKYVNIPPYLKRIESSCFENCAIEEIEFPMYLNYLGNYSFNKCRKLTKVDFSKTKSLNYLQSNCFDGCSSLRKIEIPTTIKIIENDCFRNCSSLRSILIPSSVDLIEKHAFKKCKQLQELIIINDKCRIEGSICDGCTSLTKIQMPLINGYCTYIPKIEEKEILERNE